MNATGLLILLFSLLALVRAWRLVMDQIDAIADIEVIAQDDEPMQ